MPVSIVEDIEALTERSEMEAEPEKPTVLGGVIFNLPNR